MLDERFSSFGSEVEGMRDESFRSNFERSITSSHKEETEGVNELVLMFNNELENANLTDPEEFKTWLGRAEEIRQFNPEEGMKWLGVLNEKLKEQKGH